MKRYFAMILIITIILSFAVPAYCDDALKKVGRGVCNIITCPFEFFAQIQKVSNSDGPFAGVTYGAAKGVGMTLVRAVVGVYEVATFPIPLPKHYEPILKDPEFFFEETIW